MITNRTQINNRITFEGFNARSLKGVFFTSDIGGIASAFKN